MEDGLHTGAPPPHAAAAPEKPLGENPFLKFVQRPQPLLVILAVWEIIGALTEFFTSSGLFVDLHNGELDGALGGRVFGWEQIPLAVLYLYCARDPLRFQKVFWLALIEQGVAIIANTYHWGAGDFSVESILIPVGVAGGLGVLIVLHLFEPRSAEDEAHAGTA
jgi:hypothetical protein